jgi:hypothetical protein
MQIDPLTGLKLGVKRTGIAVRRQLKCAEAEHLGGTSFVTHLAIHDAGNAVRAPAA